MKKDQSENGYLIILMMMYEQVIGVVLSVNILLVGVVIITNHIITIAPFVVQN